MLIKRKCNADPHRQLTALTRPDKVARQPAPASPRPNSPARAALGQTDSRWNKCLLLFWYANFFALKLQQQQLKKTHTHKTREHCNFHTFSAGRGTEGRMGNSKAARQLGSSAASWRQPPPGCTFECLKLFAVLLQLHCLPPS